MHRQCGNPVQKPKAHQCRTTSGLYESFGSVAPHLISFLNYQTLLLWVGDSAATELPYGMIIDDMNYTAIRELLLALIIATLMGYAWGWWPLQGFLVGALCCLYLICLLLEKVVGNG